MVDAKERARPRPRRADPERAARGASAEPRAARERRRARRSSDIAPNPDQPRRRFDDAELERLAESIRQHGVLQPVVVRRAPPDALRPYELVVGERRWRAAPRAGLVTIPARGAERRAATALLEVALVENVQRRDLNPIELAHRIPRARSTRAARRTRSASASASTARRSRTTCASSSCRRSCRRTSSSARSRWATPRRCSSSANPERRRLLRDRIVEEGLSVRAAEALARTLAAPAVARTNAPAPSAARSDPNLRQLVEQLQSHLLTRVRIEGAARHGRIEIDFYGPEELDRLARTILEGRRA